MAEFRVVDRFGTFCKKLPSAHSASIYMLGRQVSNYIIVKSDENGDRVYDVKKFTTGVVNDLEKDLEVL